MGPVGSTDPRRLNRSSGSRTFVTEAYEHSQLPGSGIYFDLERSTPEEYEKNVQNAHIQLVLGMDFFGLT
jgi:hypothetical protein